MSNNLQKHYTTLIMNSLRTQRSSIFQTADLLYEAQTNLPKAVFRRVCNDVGMTSKASVDNYIRVARSEHLRHPDIFPHLPMGVGALIDLVMWSPVEIRRCISDGVMTPGATRQALRDWRSPEKKNDGFVKVSAWVTKDEAEWLQKIHPEFDWKVFNPG